MFGQGEVNEFKCVVVGDGAVGKTCMLVSYTERAFPEKYVPTVFDNYTANLMVDEIPVNLGLWDTAGQEDFDKLRPLSYTDSEIFIVCFAVNDNASFLNVEQKWLPEVRLFAKTVPVLLVGTKSDMRDPSQAQGKEKLVPVSAGHELAKKLDLYSYVECSALTRDNLEKVFEDACRCVFTNRAKVAAPQRQQSGKGSGNSSSQTTAVKKNCCSLF